MHYRRAFSAHLQLIIAGLFVIVPVLWMLRLAFDGGIGGRPDDAALIPQLWTLENLQEAWNEPRAGSSFLELLTNSLIVTLGTVAIALLTGTWAAYALARFRFPGRRTALLACLALAALPPAGLAMPFFFYLNSLGIRQSLFGLILVYSAIATPFAIWTLHSAVQQVPRDLEESAALEGARPAQVFRLITLPLISPTLAVAGFLAFLVSWSEYALAWALISNPKLITLSMALYGMRDASQVSWSLLSATAILATLPVIVIFYALGSRALDGLSFGVAREE